MILIINDDDMQEIFVFANKNICLCYFYLSCFCSVLKCFSCNMLYCRVDRNKYQIQIPLPPKIDPSVTMMTVEEKPDVTYNDVGGCKEQIEKMREVSITFGRVFWFKLTLP